MTTIRRQCVVCKIHLPTTKVKVKLRDLSLKLAALIIDWSSCIFNHVFRRKKLVIRLANAGGLAGGQAEQACVRSLFQVFFIRSSPNLVRSCI